ncbi:MAG: hypothetical protein KIT83_02040 [Bryobacterales bacterium]|nr:hypothetical protein [Bryobacterales bacterium]
MANQKWPAGRQTSRRDWMGLALAGVGSGVLLTSCGGTVSAPTEPPAPPEPVSALRAFTFAFGKARTKASDLEVFTISNLNLEGIPSAAGKAGAWQFQFVSPSKGAIYSMRYAVADELPSFREGAWDSGSQSYSPRGMRAKPFPVQALRCDSTTAYEIAVENAADYLKKDGLPPMHFVLEQTDMYALPTWRVYWGTSLSTAEYSVYIDANQSKFLKKGKG